MIGYSERRDYTTNLVSNALWHLSINNSLESPQSIGDYNITSNKLFNILRVDMLSLRTDQLFLEDQNNKLKDLLKVIFLNSSQTFGYISYDLNREVQVNYVNFENAYENFIGNLVKYFYIGNYTLKDYSRVLQIMNPEFRYE